MPPNNPGDKFYTRHGVVPPSHELHGNMTELMANVDKVRHDWRQRGAVLFCVACPNEHATEPRFVDFLLEGTDSNGLPVMKKIHS